MLKGVPGIQNKNNEIKLGDVHKGRLHKIAKKLLPFPCPQDIRTDSNPPVLADTPYISKTPKFFW